MNTSKKTWFSGLAAFGLVSGGGSVVMGLQYLFTGDTLIGAAFTISAVAKIWIGLASFNKVIDYA